MVKTRATPPRSCTTCQFGTRDCEPNWRNRAASTLDEDRAAERDEGQGQDREDTVGDGRALVLVGEVALEVVPAAMALLVDAIDLIRATVREQNRAPAAAAALDRKALVVREPEPDRTPYPSLQPLNAI